MSGVPTPVSDPGGATRRAGWWWAGVCFAGAMALFGVARPSIAVAAVLVTALGLAIGVLAHLGWRLSRRVQPQPRSEFAPAVYQRPLQVLPYHISRIIPDRNDRKPPISAGARAGITTVATERLWARHGLNLHDPRHHDRIEHAVSADLWSVIRPDRTDSAGRTLDRHPMLHRDLDRLLDDLESL